jgi:quercetin dioxygenase-like cupin family protein
MVSYRDYTSPNTQFAFDVNKSTLIKKDNQNYINVVGIQQLNTLENVSLLDVFLSRNNIVEPHYHQKAAELVYCVSGAVTVSILNPFTKQMLNYPLTSGQVANVPQGWWHYEVATVDNTHFLAIHNDSDPVVILGSDILKLTPANIMAHTYCLDENQWNKAIAPVQPTLQEGPQIGPPKNCHNREINIAHHYMNQRDQYQQYIHQYPHSTYFPQHQQYWGR